MSYLCSMDEATQRYTTIYADPPWMETGAGKIRRGADRHYALMKTRAICELPVQQLAAPNAHLYLWATNNFLQDGFKVCEAWGFRYVTLITWAKIGKPGLGQYFRGQSEHCIFGVRGVLPYKIKDGKRQQGTTLMLAERAAHSAKPHEMYEVVERVSYGPYVELFARNERPGWDCWGSREPSQRALMLEAAR